jgi:hypothetical protein
LTLFLFHEAHQADPTHSAHQRQIFTAAQSLNICFDASSAMQVLDMLLENGTQPWA